MIEKLEKKYHQIIEIIELYNQTENSDIKKILQHHLLITSYTSYEESIKKIIQEQFRNANQNFKVQPLLINSTIKNARWTPNVKQENMVKLFPILKEWIIYNQSFNSIDTMIAARHLYAHTGSYNLTIENILTAYIQSLYILFFIYEIYILKEDVSIEFLNSALSNQNRLVTKVKKNLKECGRIIENGKDITEPLRVRFDADIGELRVLERDLNNISLSEHNMNKPAVNPSIHHIGEYQDCFNNFISTVEIPHNISFDSSLSNSLPRLIEELEKCERYFN